MRLGHRRIRERVVRGLTNPRGYASACARPTSVLGRQRGVSSLADAFAATIPVFGESGSDTAATLQQHATWQHRASNKPPKAAAMQQK